MNKIIAPSIVLFLVLVAFGGTIYTSRQTTTLTTQVQELSTRLMTLETRLAEMSAQSGGQTSSEETVRRIEELQARLESLSFKNPSTELAELQKRLSELVEQQKKAPQPQKIIIREPVKEKSRDELVTDAVAKVAPAVVSIVISKDVPQLEVVYVNPFGDDPFFKDVGVRIPQYRQKGVSRQKVGAGTGFIISKDGYIITNRHVVEDEAASYVALLSDGSQKPATIMYKDEDYDLAVVKIDAINLRTAEFGSSDTLKLGQSVVAIGNALGEYSNSVSTGIISGLNRTVQANDRGRIVTLKGVMQTDAAINPGNSGGPLLDLDGRVVGVNVATVMGSNNISFSIPVNTVKILTKRFFGK